MLQTEFRARQVAFGGLRGLFVDISLLLSSGDHHYWNEVALVALLLLLLLLRVKGVMMSRVSQVVVSGVMGGVEVGRMLEVISAVAAVSVSSAAAILMRLNSCVKHCLRGKLRRNGGQLVMADDGRTVVVVVVV